MNYRALSRLAFILAVGNIITSLSVAQDTVKNVPVSFVAVQSNSIEWKYNPEMPGYRSAIMLGNPEESGPFIVRYKLPANLQVQPHTHPNARTYTILKGEWKIGFGEYFEKEQLQRFSKGSLYWLPAGVPHYQMAGPEGATIQIESIGPDAINFLDTQ